MNYTGKGRERMFKKALNAIKKDGDILFIEDVRVCLGITRATLYRWWPKGSPEYERIFELIEDNKINMKKNIRKQLGKSTRAPELLSLYRMIATEEERRAINQTYVDVKADVDGRIEIGFVEAAASPVEDEESVEL